MKTYLAELESLAPYSQSRHVSLEELPMENNETHDVYERRMWSYRLHADDDGNVYIPPMTLKNCLTEGARHLGMKFKGNRLYGALFESGTMITEPIMLGMHRDAIKGEWLYLNSDGKKGGSKRVMRCYPKIPKWNVTASIVVLHEAITEDVLTKHIEHSGMFVGIGRFRAAKGGFYGRFKLNGLKVS